MLKINVFILAGALALGGCATQHQGQMAGAVVGAAVGSAIGAELSGGRHYGYPAHRPIPPVYVPHPPPVHYNPYAVCDRYMDPYWRNRCIWDIRAGMGRRW